MNYSRAKVSIVICHNVYTSTLNSFSAKADSVQLLNCWIYDIEPGSYNSILVKRVKLLWVDEIEKVCNFQFHKFVADYKASQNFW